ncbi:General alpha-glucoside permease [Colletotrichum siamense]|uniref:General alpha-glucoside permease n=1 Tax=Colletotrichum siamense TaxID=690259 RepID=UPI0018722BD5|nr:General alpha-glucoside permease [Colletotrichum siamense]KAF5495086.1 General alpha-glucoside permease [Colletotrichum siamense]
MKDQLSATHVEDSADKDGIRELGSASQGSETLTLRQTFRYYWKAVAWSLCVSNATIMESYDLLLINSFYAFPQFQNKYGVELPNGSYSVPARWQIGLSMANLVGMIIGVFANGYCADRWGLRKVIIASHAALIGFIFITFFAPSVEVLTVGMLLFPVDDRSLPCGFFAAATPSYAAEVSPPQLSGYLTVYVNLCWVMGKILAFGVLSGTLSIEGEWSYRIPFALQWIWPLPLMVATYLAPESPWWLARKGRIEEAENSLRRLVSAPLTVIDPKDSLATIVRTIEAECLMSIQGSYLDCFRGDSLRRTEIAMVSWGCQILPGFAIQVYITYFFTLAGLDSSDSFNLSIGNAGLAFVGTVSSWALMTRFGWRTMYLGGLIAMFPVMSLVGFLDLATSTPSGDNVRWAQCAMLLVWFFIYGASIGPVPYGIAANVGATNIRVKTISLGRNTYYFLSIINTIASPYLLNPQEGNLKGKAAFPAVAFTLLLIVWAFFRLPEIKGMSPEVLNKLFEQKVPARKFLQESKKYQ